MVPSFLPASPSRSHSISPSSSKRRPKSGELETEDIAASTVSTVEPVVTTPRQKAKKKTFQWADGGEEAQGGSVEIVVDDGRLAHSDSDVSNDEVRQSIILFASVAFKHFNQYHVGVGRSLKSSGGTCQ